MSAISFGIPRYNKNYELELLRFCNKLNINVVGGFSKLFQNSIKQLNVNSIISYCDRRLFNGKIYELVQFKHLSNTAPSYFWYKGYEIKSRYQTQKHKLNTDMTENQYMKSEGYNKVFDCGQKVYVWER